MPYKDSLIPHGHFISFCCLCIVSPMMCVYCKDKHVFFQNFWKLFQIFWKLFQSKWNFSRLTKILTCVWKLFFCMIEYIHIVWKVFQNFWKLLKTKWDFPRLFEKKIKYVWKLFLMKEKNIFPGKSFRIPGNISRPNEIFIDYLLQRKWNFCRIS